MSWPVWPNPAWLLAGYTLLGGRRGQLVVADRRTDRADAGLAGGGRDRSGQGRAGQYDTVDPDGLGFGCLDDTASRVETVVDQDLAVVLRLDGFAEQQAGDVLRDV